MALMAAIIGHTHLMAGFDNRRLTRLVGILLDQPYANRQATYDLPRLRRKGLIERLPNSNRHQLTPLGRRVAVLFTKAHGRVLIPGLAWLHPTSRTTSPPAALSLRNGDTSTPPSTTSSNAGSSQPDDLT